MLITHVCEMHNIGVIGWLYVYPFVAGAWVTIKFRWYPRMGGLGWTIYRACNFYTVRECILVAVHVVIFTIRVYTILMRMHVCVPDLIYNYVTMIMMCMYHSIHCMCWRFSYGNTLFTVLCGMPGMSLYSAISCWSCCKFNCMCAVAHHSLFIARICVIYEYGDYACACMWKCIALVWLDIPKLMV